MNTLPTDAGKAAVELEAGTQHLFQLKPFEVVVLELKGR